MNHRVIGGGAIVCSAVVFYGWMQPFTTKAGLLDCNETLTDSNASSTVEAVQRPQQPNCAKQNPISFMRILPANLPLSVQWGGLRANRLPRQMEATYEQLIKQAQELANRNQFAEAMAQTTGIPKNSRHYPVAQQLQENWSRELLQRARKSYQAADVATAINTLNTIPPTCAQFSQASDLRQRWSQQSMKFQQAIAAKDEGNWQGVISAIRALEGTQLYSTSPVQELLQFAMIQQFSPDADLMQFVMENQAEPTSAAAPVRNLEAATPPDFPLAYVEPLPDLADTTITLNQALAWAQPPEYVALKPDKPFQPKVSDGEMQVMNVSPVESSTVPSYSSSALELSM